MWSSMRLTGCQIWDFQTLLTIFFKNHTATVIENRHFTSSSMCTDLEQVSYFKTLRNGRERDEIGCLNYYQYILCPQQTVDTSNVEKVPYIYSPHLRKQHFPRICKLSKPASRSNLTVIWANLRCNEYHYDIGAVFYQLPT